METQIIDLSGYDYIGKVLMKLKPKADYGIYFNRSFEPNCETVLETENGARITLQEGAKLVYEGLYSYRIEGHVSISGTKEQMIEILEKYMRKKNDNM